MTCRWHFGFAVFVIGNVLLCAQTSQPNEQKQEPTAPQSLSTDGQAPPSSPSRETTPPVRVLKMCSDKNPPPCLTPPRPVYTPDPEYSEEGRKRRCGGTLVLWLIVGPDGKPRDTRVALPLGLGLDEKAIETVNTWRFEPAEKDGKPVATQINVEVSFRLDKMNVIQVEVFGDKMGVNFSRYRAALRNNVQTQWCKLIPEQRDLKKREITIEFAVNHDGHVNNIQFTKSSGDLLFDQAALNAITASEPFEHLPPEFKGDSIELRMHFLYNSDEMTKHSSQ